MVQALIRRTQSSHGELLSHAGSPAALFGLVQSEGASVRFSLNLSAILQGLGELGWPERDGVIAAIRCCSVP